MATDTLDLGIEFEKLPKKEKKKALLELLKQKKARCLELKKKQQKIRAEKAKYIAKQQEYERENKILYLGHEGKEYLGDHGKWELNSLQIKLVEAFMNPSKKIFTYTGANRIGKTFIAVILMYTCLTGRFPWEPEEKGTWFWDIMNWRPPIKIRWIGEDWEKHIKTVLVPKIKELWPRSHPMEIRRNSLGVETFWTEKINNSTIEIMSNRQDSSLFEGWNGHLVVYDEPPKRENRIACARGLIDFCGRELFTMTLLKEAWVHQEVINATNEDGTPDTSVFNITGDMNANIGFGITQAGVDQFSKSLTDEERSSRIKGIPSYLSGKVLIFQRDVHCIPRFDIPIHWPIDIAIDIGVAKPHDVTYVATSERGFKYVIFEQTIAGDGTQIGNEVVEKIKRYNLRVNAIVCDPLAKSDKNNESTVWAKIDDVLMKYGYWLERGSKEKEDGAILLNELLSNEYGEPALYVFNDCVRAIQQLDGWMRDEDGTIKKYKNKQLPGDDQCENLYRIALLQTQYDEPNMVHNQDRGDARDPITGY